MQFHISCQHKKVPFWFAAFAIFMSQKDSCSPEVFLVGKKKVYSFIWFTVIIHIVQYLSQKYKLRVVLGLYWICTYNLICIMQIRLILFETDKNLHKLGKLWWHTIALIYILSKSLIIFRENSYVATAK